MSHEVKSVHLDFALAGSNAKLFKTRVELRRESHSERMRKSFIDQKFSVDQNGCFFCFLSYKTC